MIRIAKTFVFFLLIFNISCKAYYIPTGSMEDTIHIGDHIFVKLLSSYEPKRGDLIVFYAPNENEKEYIKRVIAIPGDRFVVKNNHVYINNKKINEKYIKGITDMTFSSNVEISDKIVPNDSVVVLGDNRENSMDSRHFGYVDISRINGVAAFLYWNTKEIVNGEFKRFGFID